MSANRKKEFFSVDALVVVLITGLATLGSKTMPSVVPLTTNLLDCFRFKYKT